MFRPNVRESVTARRIVAICWYDIPRDKSGGVKDDATQTV